MSEDFRVKPNGDIPPLAPDSVEVAKRKPIIEFNFNSAPARLLNKMGLPVMGLCVELGVSSGRAIVKNIEQFNDLEKKEIKTPGIILSRNPVFKLLQDIKGELNK